MFSGNFDIALSIADEHNHPTFAFDSIAARFDTLYGQSSDIDIFKTFLSVYAGNFKQKMCLQ